MTSEWNKFAQRTYEANFIPSTGHEFRGDITEVEATEVPDHDVLLAGFPCQPFSIAGVSKKNALGRPHGFADETQGTLFFDVVRILKEKRPKAFLLENVRNLKSHDGGRTFKVIMGVLEKDLGYSVSEDVISATPWVPQTRSRIMIVGFDTCSNFSIKDLPRPATRPPTMRDVLHPQEGTEPADGRYTHGELGIVDPKYTLTPGLWTYLQEYRAKHRAAGHGFGYGKVGPNDVARTLSARYYKDGSEVLIDQVGFRPRRLTPREAARLMGFPDNFRIPANVSDMQAYKQFGNSVVVPLVTDVARLMAPHIRKTCQGAHTSRGS